MRWRIGRLARQAGTTVRALRHYEELGLIRPARTRSGQRVYVEQDAIRLSHVLLLRRLGLPLGEVARVLDDPEHDLARVLRRHADRLRRRIEADRILLDRLDALARGFRSGGDGSSVDELLRAVGRMEMQEKYFTAEQIEQLAERRRTLGNDAIREAEREWPDLIARARELLDHGVAPDDPRAQRIATRWHELVQAFTGGDPGLAASVDRMYRDEPGLRANTGLDETLLTFISEAHASADG